MIKRNSKISDRAIQLIKTNQPHYSKFGGTPGLPENIPWPTDTKGHELNFLAQIHCPELPVTSGLPENGTLFVFYDTGSLTDYSNPLEVIYTTDPLPAHNRTPAAENGIKPIIYRETFLTFKMLQTAKTPAAPHHQLLGRSYDIQRNTRPAGYTLLLQLDSDISEDGPRWMWYDAGLLYFWIKPEDLAAKRFDRIKLTRDYC